MQRTLAQYFPNFWIVVFNSILRLSCIITKLWILNYCVQRSLYLRACFAEPSASWAEEGLVRPQRIPLLTPWTTPIRRLRLKRTIHSSMLSRFGNFILNSKYLRHFNLDGCHDEFRAIRLNNSLFLWFTSVVVRRVVQKGDASLLSSCSRSSSRNGWHPVCGNKCVDHNLVMLIEHMNMCECILMVCEFHLYFPSLSLWRNGLLSLRQILS
jgi:hypothetical protein